MATKIPILMLFDYVEAHPETSAKSIAAGLQWDVAKVNVMLYRSPRVFVSMGKFPPLWSARSISRRRVTALEGEQ